MKTVAVFQEDLATGALGLPSLAAEDFLGEPVLRAMVRGLVEYSSIDAVAILTPAAARDRLASLLEGLPVTFHEPGPDTSLRPLWRRGRKWATSSWRSGLGNASVLDEWGAPADLRRVLNETGATAVVKVAVLNPIVDGELLDELLAAARKVDSEVLLLPSPPGFHFEYYRAPFLDEMIEKGVRTGDYLTLSLDRTNRDPVLTEAFFRPAEALIEGRFRVAADTRHGLEVVREIARLWPVGPKGWRGDRIEAGLLAEHELWHRRLPREIEVEVTGRTSLPHPQRPRPRADLADMPLDLFERIVREVGAAHEDAVLTFGGHGEPLLHPELLTMVRRAKEAGVWGVAVVTDGLALEGELARGLLESGVDVVSISVDAEDPAVYERLNGADVLARVQANASSFIDASIARGPNRPFVVVEMVKRPETMSDLEPFFDRWFRRTGWVVIRPANEYCGQLPDVNPMPLFLSQRTLCQKIQSALVVHVDGRVPVCAQDYLGRWPAGDVRSSTIESIWTGPLLAQLRRAHQAKQYDTFPLCSTCRYWQSV